MSKTDFSSPFTPLGIRLGDEAALGLPVLRIEECGYHARGLDWNFDDVVSPFWRLYWNATPGSYLVVNGGKVPLRPDSVLLVPEALRFDTRGKKGTPHLWLHFTVVPHRRYGAEAPARIKVNASILACLKAVQVSLPPGGDSSRFFHRAHALLHAALAGYDGFQLPRLPEALEKLLEYIDMHMADELSNPALAARCHRSVEGFIRWFDGHMNLSPQKYVTECRVRRAARELAVTEDSVERIAERNGFANRNYFTRIFAQVTGTPPAQFRAKALSR